MRQSIYTYFLSMATLVSSRGTCSRRKVGCVLTNKYNHVIATGYNGTPRGAAHCIDKPCKGSKLPSGQGLDLCRAIHAEQNALLQCKNVYEIEAAYVTAAPCMSCVKLLANTSCRVIYFLEEYPHMDEARDFWIGLGRNWYNCSKNSPISIL